MTTMNSTENSTAFHAKALADAVDGSRRWILMLQRNLLFRHHKGRNCHAEQAETFKDVLIAAADHFESTATSETAFRAPELCTSVRFVAELFCESVHLVTRSRSLNKEQFRIEMIERITGCFLLAELLLLELRELERHQNRARKRTAGRRGKRSSAVILPFQPRTI